MDIIFKKHLINCRLKENNFSIKLGKFSKDHIIYSLIFDGLVINLCKVEYIKGKWIISGKEFFDKKDVWTITHTNYTHNLRIPYLPPLVWIIKPNESPEIIYYFTLYQRYVLDLLESLSPTFISKNIKNRKLINIILTLKTFNLPYEIIYHILKYMAIIEILY